MTMRPRGQRSPNRSSRRFASRPREPLMWTSATLINQSTVAGAVLHFDALGAFTLTEKHNITGLVRAHMHLIYKGATTNNPISFAAGLIVADDDAIAAGAVSDPFTDADASWALHTLGLDESITDDTQHIRMDSKSRRRIPIKKSLDFGFEVQAATSTVEWGVSLRLLLQRGR